MLPFAHFRAAKNFIVTQAKPGYIKKITAYAVRIPLCQFSQVTAS